MHCIRTLLRKEEGPPIGRCVKTKIENYCAHHDLFVKQPAFAHAQEKLQECKERLMGEKGGEKNTPLAFYTGIKTIQAAGSRYHANCTSVLLLLPLAPTLVSNQEVAHRS